MVIIIIVGNYANAEKLFSKLLNRNRKKFGDGHLSTLNTMNLANTYDRQCKYSDAEVLFKQCLDKRKAVLGENHPDTIRTMNGLAGVVSKIQSRSEY